MPEVRHYFLIVRRVGLAFCSENMKPLKNISWCSIACNFIIGLRIMSFFLMVIAPKIFLMVCKFYKSVELAERLFRRIFINALLEFFFLLFYFIFTGYFASSYFSSPFFFRSTKIGQMEFSILSANGSSGVSRTRIRFYTKTKFLVKLI